MQQSVRLIPHQPEINSLREQMVQAQRSKDAAQMQRAVLKQRALYSRIGVSMPAMMIAPFIQLPVTLGMFFGVKRICDLPVEQLKWSGVDFLPDLTVADPTYILPLIATVAMNAQLSVCGFSDTLISVQRSRMTRLSGRYERHERSTSDASHHQSLPCPFATRYCLHGQSPFGEFKFAKNMPT